MIPADNLLRLVRNIIGGDPEGFYIARVLDLAQTHALDVEDLATLARVAAGEVAEPARVYRFADDVIDRGLLR